ncbi:MAG: ATP-binding protein [Treponema sp.]|nr:ATP-binding protein [Treponema sp.]
MHFTLTDLITDITQNGAESGGSVVELHVSEMKNPSINKEEFRFTVIDNGKGMSEEELKRAQDPFVTDGVKHPHRKVGLGLPFLIQTAEASGGGWKMESVKGSGTTINAWFDLANVDTPPVGDIPGMFRTVLLFGGPEEMVIKRLRESPEGNIDYELRKTELHDALGDLEETKSLILLDKYLRSLEEPGE